MMVIPLVMSKPNTCLQLKDFEIVI